MAHDLFGGSDLKLKMEEIARELSQHFVESIFLATSESNEYGELRTCKMHDLVHDLTRFVGRRDWLICEIGELKHLRYLGLSHNPFKELQSRFQLYTNLRTLGLEGCKHLGGLPKGLIKLVNLRHLHIDKFMKVHAGIERLTCLQILPCLELSASNGEWKLHELGCLRDVRGWLQIGGLEHAKCKEEAQKAEIGAKAGISFLHLAWSSLERDEDSSIVEELEVLDGLQPHPNLQGLIVQGFNGDSFPGWLRRMTVVNNDNLASLDNLVVVRLIVGYPLLTITPTGFPSLRDLELRQIKSAQRLLQCGKWSYLTSLILEDVEDLSNEFGEQFISLETLEIIRCRKLACLPEDLGKLTSLKKLDVRWCPKLKSLPDQLRRLTALEELTYCWI
ncbi:hypothetical protein Dimus_036908 [Dionaea muscipula]